ARSAGDVELDRIVPIARRCIATHGVGVGGRDGLTERDQPIQGDGIAGAGDGNYGRYSTIFQFIDLWLIAAWATTNGASRAGQPALTQSAQHDSSSRSKENSRSKGCRATCTVTE